MYKKGWDCPLYILRVHIKKFQNNNVLQFYHSKHCAGPDEIQHHAIYINAEVLVKIDFECVAMYIETLCILTNFPIN